MQRKKISSFFRIFDCVSELFMALTAALIGSSGSSVESTARLVQWRIENLSSFPHRKCQNFKLGIWKWWISVEKSKVLQIKLSVEHSGLAKPPPIASFTVQILSLGVKRQRFTFPEIIYKEFKKKEEFVWDVELALNGRIIVDIEFLDIKIADDNGGEPQSIWNANQLIENSKQRGPLMSLEHLFHDSFHTDVIINTSDGSIGAHRAILAAGSPVFASMFTHNFKENETSMVNIEDMSYDECRAVLSYMYGCLSSKEFQMHRLALLHAAEKYDLKELKAACEESLVNDINCKNVLDRIYYASLCSLPNLKRECIRYLVDFGKVYELGEDLNDFIQDGDRDSLVEIFQEILNVWKLG